MRCWLDYSSGESGEIHWPHEIWMIAELLWNYSMDLSKEVRWALLKQILGQEAKGSLCNKYGLPKKTYNCVSKQLTAIIEDTAGTKPVSY